MCEIIIMVLQQNGRMFYEFRNHEEFDNEYDFLSNNSYLQGAVLKRKLWDDSNDWRKLHDKIKSMRW